MSTLQPKTSKKTTAPRGKGGVKGLSEVAIKQRLRPSTPRAIERLKELLESRNESIAFAAVKLIINKFVPDLRVTEIQGSEKKPILIELDINESKIHGAGKVPTKTKISI